MTRGEFEKNYQRLTREHLELEKSHALLQGQLGQGYQDPGREIKVGNTSSGYSWGTCYMCTFGVVRVYNKHVQWNLTLR